MNNTYALPRPARAGLWGMAAVTLLFHLVGWGGTSLLLRKY